MRHYNWMTALVLVVAGTGCSPQGDDDTTAAGTPPDEPQHVWKEQVQTLDKARAVEQTLMDAQQRRAAEQPE